MCIHKLTLEDKKRPGTYNTVPCGKCNICLQARKQDWAIRLGYEMRSARSAYFITLTYDTQHLPWEIDTHDGIYMEPTLHKQQLFTWHKSAKRLQQRWLRKFAREKKLNYKKLAADWQQRYYSVGEYGTKYQRPHYHTIIFGIHPELVEDICNLWGKGHTFVGTVTGKSINYVTKYLIDKDERKNAIRQKPFTTMSRNPGLGYKYVNEKQSWHKPTVNGVENDILSYQYHFQDGQYKKRLPRYYKNKLFNEFERQIMSIRQGALAAMKEDKIMKQLITECNGNEHRARGIYQERLQHKHDSIKTKSLTLNNVL